MKYPSFNSLSSIVDPRSSARACFHLSTDLSLWFRRWSAVRRRWSSITRRSSNKGAAMWKPSLVPAIFFVSACVTVNIYFPAAAVERAAEEIVKETWGGPDKPPPKGQPQSGLPSGQTQGSAPTIADYTMSWLNFASEAYAQ